MSETNAMDALEERVHRMDSEERSARALSAARIKLILGKDARSVFFATLALKLQPEPCWDIPSMATDGQRLIYNPDFVLGLKEPERIGVLCHEVMHLVLKHHCRRGPRELERWNIACDLACNPLIVEGGYTLPPGRRLPGQGQHKDLPPGLGAEEYYRLLEKPPQDGDGEEEGGGDPSQDGQGDGPGQGEMDSPCPDPGGCGGIMDAGDGSPAAQKESEAEWEVAVSQAAETAKQKGALPGGLARLAEEVLTPKVDWKDVLREFVSRQARNDFSMSPPNRRFIHMGLYLPGLRSEELGEIVLAVDTSGSIGPRELSVFSAEIQGILESFDTELTILYHDSDVQHVQHWKSSDGPLIMEPRGGGGTSHIPVFEYVEEHGLDPTCMVCLTDLHTDLPSQAPEYPVLWAVVGNKNPTASFGQIVEVTV